MRELQRQQSKKLLKLLKREVGVGFESHIEGINLKIITINSRLTQLIDWSD